MMLFSIFLKAKLGITNGEKFICYMCYETHDTPEVSTYVTQHIFRTAALESTALYITLINPVLYSLYFSLHVSAISFQFLLFNIVTFG